MFCTIIVNRIFDLTQSGKKYLDEGNYSDALSCFEQALSLDPANPDLWNLKGMALRSLGRYDGIFYDTSFDEKYKNRFR